MSSRNRLTNAYKKAKRISFNDDSKIILFSDCHRGDNSFADDFANNRNIYFHALKHYFDADFTYIELGDGNELWENHLFKPIFEAHKNVFMLLKKFHEAGRLEMIWGNHDMVYKDPKVVKKHLASFFEPVVGKQLPLFKDLVFNEALVLEHQQSKQELFLLHGHQADWFNYVLWQVGRFFVRVLWRPLQIVGISDPTSPAKNYKELIKVERRLKNWIVENNLLLTITGHTHRPRFPDPGEIPFFNDGSCVHPRSITGIEIEKGAITLIKWHIDTKPDGSLQVSKEVLEGPTPLKEYQNN